VCRFHVVPGAEATPETFSRHRQHFLVSLPKSASNNLRKWFLSPTARLNFGFISEEKLTVVLITPYSLGSQLVYAPTSFLAPLPGERGFLQRESLTSNFFTLLLFCLVSLLYFCLHIFIKNTKKLVPFIVVIFVYLF
jgi:hypothetical protein